MVSITTTSATCNGNPNGANYRGAFVSVFKIYLPFVDLCWLLFQFGRALAARTLVITTTRAPGREAAA